jgi:hypothetical protein
LLDCVVDPGEDAMALVHWLLSNGCESPLYNPDIPAAALDAALERVARALRHAEGEMVEPWRALSDGTAHLGGAGGSAGA